MGKLFEFSNESEDIHQISNKWSSSSSPLSVTRLNLAGRKGEISMEVIPLHIKDAYIVRVKMNYDHRGCLAELFNMNAYPKDINRHFPVQQVTWSTNHKNSVRGLHISPYAKLLTCVQGSVHDVIVDMRPESPSYLQWAAVHLTADNGLQALIPPDCGHGYLALEEGSAVIYCQGGFFDPAVPQHATSVFDPILSVDWPIEDPEKNVLISTKDQNVKHLSSKEVGIMPHRKRILVIGSTGQVGSICFKLIEKSYPEFLAIGTTHSLKTPQRIPFDLETDAMEPWRLKLLVDICSPHVIIIAAAFSNVNLCESQKKELETAQQSSSHTKGDIINCEAVAAIGKIATERNIQVVNFSTDYVFNSPKPENLPTCCNLIENDFGLKEDSPKNPPNYYGVTKSNGEEALLAACPSALVIRTTRIYGPEEIRKNFVNQVVKNLSNGKEMNLLTDEISCPTYGRDLTTAVMLLIKKRCSGIYHIVGPEVMSKYQWGLKIAEYFKLDTKLLVPKDSTELKLPAPRGKFSGLSTSKFRTEFPDFKFRTITEGLDDWKESNELFPQI